MLGGDPSISLSAYVIEAMKDPLSDPEAFVEVSELVDILQLQLLCPFCRSVMRKRPIPAVAVEEVIRGLDMGLNERGEVEANSEERLGKANTSFEQYLLF